MKIHLRDALSSLVVFALGLSAFIMAGSFGGGSGTFPRLISGIMMASAALMFVRSFVRPPETVEVGADEPSDFRRLTPFEAARTTIAIILTTAYILLIQPLGFFTASFIYIPVSAYALGLRNHVAIWSGTVIYIAASFYIFRFIFRTPLPQEALLRLF